MGKITYMELFNDLNSKKRNKKILITTEAIEKSNIYNMMDLVMKTVRLSRLYLNLF